MLSLGEQQRVAMLRLLCHTPTLAFLDEATSAVDADVEQALYAALAERCLCYVSIGACIAAVPGAEDSTAAVAVDGGGDQNNRCDQSCHDVRVRVCISPPWLW